MAVKDKLYRDKFEKQREVFDKIDSTMAILSLLPVFVDIPTEYSVSPLDFIFKILQSLGVSEETLRKWIVNILTFVLPEVEVGVKASLLANIKATISCNSDPRIPLRLRKKISETVYTNVLTGLNEERGIDINIDAIDPQGWLDLSPFTNPGKFYYFGCDNSKVSKLARADDFNAFLWYVIHKGNKQNPSKATITGNILTIDGDSETYEIISGNLGLLGAIEVKVNGDSESNIIAGDTFYSSENANYIAVCIENKVDEQGKITGSIIVPISSDWYSCNWYVDKSNYYIDNVGITKKIRRNYSEEKGICNLRYCQQYDYRGNIMPNAPNILRFFILPKPYVLLPSLDEMGVYKNTNEYKIQWRPIRLLFDADGKANQKGKFSLISETYDLQPTLTNKTTTSDGEFTYYNVLGIEENGVKNSAAGKLCVNNKTGDYKLVENQGKFENMLVECYPGLTIYEFNYDYIMGMKLFDPKVICQKIFDNSINPKYDVLFGFSLNKLNDKSIYPFLSGKQRIIEIVKEILEEDEDEINDCFYVFSNEQYDEMLKKTEEIRYRQLPYNQGYNECISVNFDEVTKILEKYPENGTIEAQKGIINDALSKACDIINKRNNMTVLSDMSTSGKDFLMDVLKSLVACLIDSLLSPKILMLLMINEALMNGSDEQPLNASDLMMLFNNVIKSLVREVRDLIIKKMLDYIIEYLTPMALQLQAKIYSEQFDSYMAIIRLLLNYFNKGVETVSQANSILSSVNSILKDKFGSSYGDITDIDLPSILDDVNYADIYLNDIKDKEPINNNC